MSASLDLTVKNLMAYEDDLSFQLTDNSMDLRLTQKQSANKIQMVRDQYAPEKERINNEIDSLDKVEQRDEYQDLMAELNDLKEEEEAQITRLENELEDDETAIQMENETVEVQLEDAKTQRESFQEMRKENNENFFGYFQ